MRAPFLIACSLIVLAGCGGSDSAESTTTASAAPTTQPAPTPTVAADPGADTKLAAFTTAAENADYTATPREIGGRTDLKIQTPEFLATVIFYANASAATAEGKDFEKLARSNPTKVHYAVVTPKNGSGPSRLWWMSEAKAPSKQAFLDVVEAIEDCGSDCAVSASR